jgi:multicomponent Na+:H+ antiporter subunit C
MNNQLDVAVLVALLAGSGFYLCTSRRLLRVLFGVVLLSNAANLVLLSSSGDPSGRAAPVIIGEAGPLGRADPLPQALILTAIVIGFAVIAYFAVLIYRIYADRRHATVPALFADDPHPESPAARDLALDAEQLRLEQEAVAREDARRAAEEAHGHHGHAHGSGHDDHGHGHDDHGQHGHGGKGGHA